MKRIAFAALLAAGIGAAPALAQAPDSAGRTPGGGNVGGGGLGATLLGSGDDMVILYSSPGAGGGGGAARAQAGPATRFTGSDGDGPQIGHAGPAAAGGTGREAWVLGGGDNAEVAYGRPR